MRIVGGKWAGRHLTSPGDQRVRPTAEGVRDAWMGLLEPWLQGARVLDLFAGTGALGLEALSRGARYADFVEFGPASLSVKQLIDQAGAMGLDDAADLYHAQAARIRCRFLRQAERRRESPPATGVLRPRVRPSSHGQIDSLSSGTPIVLGVEPTPRIS